LAKIEPKDILYKPIRHWEQLQTSEIGRKINRLHHFNLSDVRGISLFPLLCSLKFTRSKVR